MTDLNALLIVIVTAIYWLKRNKDLIIWQRKFEAYGKLILSFNKIKVGYEILARLEKKNKEDEHNAELGLKTINQLMENLLKLNEDIGYGAFVISQKAINILENCINELDAKNVTNQGSGTILDKRSKELSTEAQLDLESIQPSFSRSMKNIWRDIKLFCR